MQDRYWSIIDLQSAAGSFALEKSMHSSRLAFSSLHTQQGLGLLVAVVEVDVTFAAALTGEEIVV
jgi:hypothetical protein